MVDHDDTDEDHVATGSAASTCYNKASLATYEGIPIVRWLVLQRICPNRRAASDVIPKVRINSVVVTSLSQLVQETDNVEFDCQPIKKRKIDHVYYVLNKPPGCLSSRRNVQQIKGGNKVVDARPSVYDYLPEEDRFHVNSIGRLDFDTTGLLIFTSDGILHHALATPKFKVRKIYRCTLRKPEPLSDDAIEQLKKGVQLPHAQGAIVSGDAWNVTDNDGVVDLCISGGYKHQVKLMLSRVKRPLRLLHRRTFANLELPDDVKEGECRTMTEGEVQHLYSLAKQQMEMQRAGEKSESTQDSSKLEAGVTVVEDS